MNKNSNKYKSLLTDIIIFTVGSFSSKLILFFLVPIYTNYLTTEEYGLTELILTIGNLVIPFVSIVIYDAVLRFSLDKKCKDEDVLRCGLTVVSVGSVIMVSLMPLWNYFETFAPWKWFFCAYVIVYMFQTVILVYIKVSGRSKLFAILQILTTTLMATLSILFLVVIRLKVQGYLLANILSLLIVAIIATLIGGVINDIKDSKFDIILAKKMITYSAPLVVNNVSWWVIQSSDKLMIKVMVSISALGLFTAASKIPALVNIIISIFSQAWNLSAVREYDSSKDTNFFSSVFNIFVMIVFFAVIFINLIIKVFMQYYVGSEFFISWKFIPLLIVSASFSAISSFYGTIYGALNKSKNVMWTTLCSAINNIILNYVLILKYGVMGAVIATCFSYFLIAVLRLFDTRRYFKFPIDFAKLILSTLIILGQAICVSLEWNICLISGVSFILFMLLNKGSIFGLLNLIKNWRR